MELIPYRSQRNPLEVPLEPPEFAYVVNCSKKSVDVWFVHWDCMLRMGLTRNLWMSGLSIGIAC